MNVPAEYEFLGMPVDGGVKVRKTGGRPPSIPIVRTPRPPNKQPTPPARKTNREANDRDKRRKNEAESREDHGRCDPRRTLECRIDQTR